MFFHQLLTISYFCKKTDLARIRTWNLLIRSQTRYPLRHKATVTKELKRAVHICVRILMKLRGKSGSPDKGLEPLTLRLKV
jgi:hypothetical protein